MKRLVASTLFLALVATTLPASADNHPSNNGGNRPSAPQRQAPPPQRQQAPPLRQAPPARPAAPAPQAPRQFPLNNDLHAPVYHAPITTRPVAPVYHAPVSRPVNTVNRPPSNAQQHQFGPPHNGRIITRPHYSRTPWGWNRNVVWNPAPAYWGGGFWGPFAFDLTLATFGAFGYNGYNYDSYQVQPGTPGAQLLIAYQLTQTPCGPPNLVVIWGPDNSVICAYPNDLVGPGQYTIDPTTLTLVSSDGQGT